MRPVNILSAFALIAVIGASSVPASAEEAPISQKQLSGHKICWNGHGSALFGAGGIYRFFKRDGSPGKKNGTWAMEGGTVHVSHSDGSVAFMNLSYDPQSGQITSAGDKWIGTFC